MEGMFPSWLLPLWIIGAPTILVLVNFLTSRNDHSETLRNPYAAAAHVPALTPATR